MSTQTSVTTAQASQWNYNGFCPMFDILSTRRFGCWLCSCVQIICCNFTDRFLISMSVQYNMTKVRQNFNYYQYSDNDLKATVYSTRKTSCKFYIIIPQTMKNVVYNFHIILPHYSMRVHSATITSASEAPTITTAPIREALCIVLSSVLYLCL